MYTDTYLEGLSGNTMLPTMPEPCKGYANTCICSNPHPSPRSKVLDPKAKRCLRVLVSTRSKISKPGLQTIREPTGSSKYIIAVLLQIECFRDLSCNHTSCYRCIRIQTTCLLTSNNISISIISPFCTHGILYNPVLGCVPDN